LCIGPEIALVHRMFTKRMISSAGSMPSYFGSDEVLILSSPPTTNLSVPEKALMFAVLADAVETYQQSAFSNSRRKQNLFREAEEWFYKEEGDYLFSFKGICEALGFDPAFLRRGLILWTARRQENRAPRVKLQIHSVRSPRRRRSRPARKSPARSFGRSFARADSPTGPL
jgi:hypothetical protein